MSAISTYQSKIQTSQSIFEQKNGKDFMPEARSTNTSSIPKQLSDLPKNTNTNLEQQLLMQQTTSKVNCYNSTWIWPVGISYQPDFIEIVVTDDEMSAYWDTIIDWF
ncbi:unnamed protein product [Rotaria sp. Silwood2]|nr:unnamed protein product [Rotaria sp. Silwood2]CAF2854849.1 unnamed protein product [Rotaria sp. Silwood2]CAF4482076.1 unnamed protein product [Rotaria sp. Silwood2]CAF4523244.1 unnamed protein product [Rotaria sp. Silwood2]